MTKNFSFTKILFCVVTVVAFWSALIWGSPFYTINLADEQLNVYKYDHSPVTRYFDDNIGSYKAILPAEKVIILRMDDVQGYLWRDLSINLTDTVLANDMSITLAVIPDRAFDSDSIMRLYLIEKSNDNRIEIAQHGFKHNIDEFLYLNESEAHDSILSGLDTIMNLLKVKPVTFIPPYNTYNNNTTIALSKLDFSIISGEMDDYGYINNVASFGFNTKTKNSTDNELIPVDTIFDECNKSLQEKNICVIMIHPQDYADSNGMMNNTKYIEFVKMLNGLKSLGARSITFKDLVKYE
jgi:Uncharacterized protein conserved in bacteria (DUF2334)